MRKSIRKRNYKKSYRKKNKSLRKRKLNKRNKSLKKRRSKMRGGAGYVWKQVCKVGEACMSFVGFGEAGGVGPDGLTDAEREELKEIQERVKTIHYEDGFQNPGVLDRLRILLRKQKVYAKAKEIAKINRVPLTEQLIEEVEKDIDAETEPRGFSSPKNVYLRKKLDKDKEQDSAEYVLLSTFTYSTTRPYVDASSNGQALRDIRLSAKEKIMSGSRTTAESTNLAEVTKMLKEAEDRQEEYQYLKGFDQLNSPEFDTLFPGPGVYDKNKVDEYGVVVGGMVSNADTVSHTRYGMTKFRNSAFKKYEKVSNEIKGKYPLFRTYMEKDENRDLPSYVKYGLQKSK